MIEQAMSGGPRLRMSHDATLASTHGQVPLTPTALRSKSPSRFVWTQDALLCAGLGAEMASVESREVGAAGWTDY